jgi:hypothetical protein
MRANGRMDVKGSSFACHYCLRKDSVMVYQNAHSVNVFTRWQKYWYSGWLLGLLVLSISLVGCGKSSSKASKLPDPLQACDLLTKAEAEAIIGGPVDEPQKNHKEQDDPKHWMSSCNYYSSEKSISTGITIMPHGRKVNGAEAFALYEADLKEGLGDDYKMETVGGIGDKSAWEKNMKQLTIFQGPFMIIITTVSPELQGTAALDFSKELAAKVLSKLP